MMNALLAARDLARLSRDQKDFLVERIDHELDNNEKIREIIASKLQESLSLVDPTVKVVKGSGTKKGSK